MALTPIPQNYRNNVDWILGNNKEYLSDYGYETFIKDIDTVILGYNTYSQIINELSPDNWVYKDLKKLCINE